MKATVNRSGSYYSNNNGRIYRGSSKGILPIYNVDGDQPIHCVGFNSYADLSGSSGDEESHSFNGVGLLSNIPSVEAEDSTAYKQWGETHSFTSVEEVEAKILFNGSASHLAMGGYHSEIYVSCEKGTEIEIALTTLFGEGWSSNGVYSKRIQSYWRCSCSYHRAGENKHTHDVDYNLIKGLNFFCPYDPTKGFKEKKNFCNCSVEEQLNVIISAYQAGATRDSFEYCHKAYWEDEFRCNGKYYTKVVVSDLEKYFTLVKSEGLENTIKTLTKKITDLVLKIGYKEAMRLVRTTKSLSKAMKIVNGKHFIIVTDSIGYKKIKSYVPQFLRIAA
jgi:hypothetical protein